MVTQKHKMSLKLLERKIEDTEEKLHLDKSVAFRQGNLFKCKGEFCAPVKFYLNLQYQKILHCI